MTTDYSQLPPTAPLSESLLARKGAATVNGFAGAPELVPPSAKAPVAACARKRILIVEDDALNMKMMTDLFEGNGFHPLPAVNGLQGLAIARAERPDLIVMDIELPGLSGLDLVRRLKADPALMAIPVIAVTARVSARDEAVARHAGCDDYLAKPVPIACMLSTVARFLCGEPGGGAILSEKIKIEGPSEIERTGT